MLSLCQEKKVIINHYRTIYSLKIGDEHDSLSQVWNKII